VFSRVLGSDTPDFTVAKYRDNLLALHRQIGAEGAFATTTSRVLIEAHKPA